eukprot:361100-Chlamydomonas_euryale.AAC.3
MNSSRAASSPPTDTSRAVSSSTRNRRLHAHACARAHLLQHVCVKRKRAVQKVARPARQRCPGRVRLLHVGLQQPQQRDVDLGQQVAVSSGHERVKQLVDTRAAHAQQLGEAVQEVPHHEDLRAELVANLRRKERLQTQARRRERRPCKLQLAIGASLAAVRRVEDFHDARLRLVLQLPYQPLPLHLQVVRRARAVELAHARELLVLVRNRLGHLLLPLLLLDRLALLLRLAFALALRLHAPHLLLVRHARLLHLLDTARLVPHALLLRPLRRLLLLALLTHLAAGLQPCVQCVKRMRQETATTPTLSPPPPAHCSRPHDQQPAGDLLPSRTVCRNLPPAHLVCWAAAPSEVLLLAVLCEGIAAGGRGGACTIASKCAACTPFWFATAGSRHHRRASCGPPHLAPAHLRRCASARP